MSIADFFITTFGPGAIIDIIQKTNWYDVGKAQSKPLDVILDSQFKNKSEIIQKEVAPAVDAFCRGFKDGLLEDQK